MKYRVVFAVAAVFSIVLVILGCVACFAQNYDALGGVQ